MIVMEDLSLYQIVDEERGARARFCEEPSAAAVATASVTLGEYVRSVAATDRIAGPPCAMATLLVQVMERVVTHLGTGAQGGDTTHVEECAVVVSCEGCVEVSHGGDSNRAPGRIANFWSWGELRNSRALGVAWYVVFHEALLLGRSPLRK